MASWKILTEGNRLDITIEGKTRAVRAGLLMGIVLVEWINLMYQNNTVLNLYLGLMRPLNKDFEKRKAEKAAKEAEKASAAA